MGRGLSLGENNFGKFSQVKFEMHVRHPGGKTYQVGPRIYESRFRREISI